MAEREGFEPPIPVKVCPLSRRIVSTTHAPLRAVKKSWSGDILSGAESGETFLNMLLVPQGFNRVNLHGPMCWNVTRQQCNG
jgi:hypothetical protein